MFQQISSACVRSWQKGVVHLKTEEGNKFKSTQSPPEVHVLLLSSCKSFSDGGTPEMGVGFVFQ